MNWMLVLILVEASQCLTQTDCTNFFFLKDCLKFNDIMDWEEGHKRDIWSLLLWLSFKLWTETELDKLAAPHF